MAVKEIAQDSGTPPVPPGSAAHGGSGRPRSRADAENEEAEAVQGLGGSQ